MIRLDLVQQVATAYLNVLRTKAFERIQRNNLKITRTNLEAARYRDSIGAAGPGEVYRWDSELATNRTNVIKASVRRELSEQALNQMLNRPLTETFSTEEVDINDPRLMTSNERLFKLIDNPWAFEIFCDFIFYGSSVLFLSSLFFFLFNNSETLAAFPTLFLI